MKQLSKKDYVIIGLFFVFLWLASSLAAAAIFFDVSFQTMLAQNPVMNTFSRIGHVLSLPVWMVFIMPINFLGLMGVNVHSTFYLFYVCFCLPLLTALIYSTILMFVLEMYRSRAKRLVKKA